MTTDSPARKLHDKGEAGPISSRTQMLGAVPKRWFSWDFTVLDGQTPVADIDVSWWRERGVLTIENRPYQVYREGLLSGAFVLEGDHGVLARASKPSAFTRRIAIESQGRRYELKPKSVFTRAFDLLRNDKPAGSLSPEGLFTRRMRVDLPEELPLPVRVFIVWLTVILWKRQHDQAAAGG